MNVTPNVWIKNENVGESSSETKVRLWDYSLLFSCFDFSACFSLLLKIRVLQTFDRLGGLSAWSTNWFRDRQTSEHSGHTEKAFIGMWRSGGSQCGSWAEHVHQNDLNRYNIQGSLPRTDWGSYSQERRGSQHFQHPSLLFFPVSSSVRLWSWLLLCPFSLLFYFFELRNTVHWRYLRLYFLFEPSHGMTRREDLGRG